MTTYTAQVTRDQDAWSIYIPEIERTTQALNLRSVEEMATDLVRIMTGEPTDAITIHVVLPQDLTVAVEAASRAKRTSEQAQRSAAQAMRDAASALQAQGASVRDIGAVLGVSYQRAHQLVT